MSIFARFVLWNDKSCSAMAHITERKRKDGSFAYLAQIQIKRKGKWVHREARSFDRKTAAVVWVKKRMKEIETVGEDLSSIRNLGRKLADANDCYNRKSVKEILPHSRRSAWHQSLTRWRGLETEHRGHCHR